jgi:hypothetical protein
MSVIGGIANIEELAFQSITAVGSGLIAGVLAYRLDH